jgi:N-acetylmuramoyl-L-alanine amidase
MRYRPARNRRFSSILLIFHLWLLPQIGYAASLRLVKEVRFRSEPASTRVVIETDGSLQYATGRLPNPERLYVDLLQARLASGWQKEKLAVDDARVTAIRVAQHRRGVVRFVVDIQQIKTYAVFSLQTPYRIVIDLQGTQLTQRPPPQVQAPLPQPPRQPTEARKSAPSTRYASPPTIVIDPGHGGKDPGALGPNGMLEKDVVLQVAKALRQLIHKHMPRYQVVMTRETDVFRPLTERTKLANDNHAEVFVSLHTNASKRHSVRGIETWYFSFEAKTERAQDIAARENNMSLQQFSELERILRDLHETDRINQSALLAGATQKALVSTLTEQDHTIPDRGVDGAPFIVLLRTEMPSILVEIGFLTNKGEAARLQHQSYQQTLARGIFEGLNTFLSKSVVKLD